MAEDTIAVEVIYAGTGKPIRRSMDVPRGSTVAKAIDAAGIVQELPGGTMVDVRIGIFSRYVPMHHLLRDGDRIEIYRPLRLDPMEARRRRASET